MAIGLSKDGKWVFNKACTTPWCHAVVHFEVKMSRFPAVFQDNRRKHGGTSLKQVVTELGLPCRGFTPPFRGQG